MERHHTQPSLHESGRTSPAGTQSPAPRAKCDALHTHLGRLVYRPDGREAHVHARAAPERAMADAEARAMHPRNLIDDRKPQATAYARGSGATVKALPHARSLALRNARTIILDFQIGMSILDAAAHRDVAIARRVLERIVDQILEQILEQPGVAGHAGLQGVGPQVDA